ncbi:MAG: hypothetical protein U0Q16_19875 [Bryobacteraceae bacterium]
MSVLEARKQAAREEQSWLIEAAIELERFSEPLFPDVPLRRMVDDDWFEDGLGI